MTKLTNLLMLGDSITHGFNGYHDLQHNISYYLKQELPNFCITNAGINAGSLSGQRERDLTFQVDHHDFTKFQFVTIAYGTNDFAHSTAGLTTIGKILQTNLTKIRSENHALNIIGILPTNRYDGNIDNYHVEGLGHYTFEELLTELERVYQTNAIPVINWRQEAPELITEDNFKTALADQRLHPSEATYQKMAQLIARKIKQITGQ
ncbi:hypothetical protein B808_325 [Fructilactobacillus florum 8D]|uniref:SGNH hydrolase-type esterase domain-containing protein n=2 Tax=Fructilactobacillus florum TaxID=640331 RepID=W9EF36_9LACO|nr:SGNH/GDSL hydrolase family protein [Fructilactobacillus florum]EKK20437.1 hypothetical protein B807_788 [Fructilactobacillus florum 2F]ETO40748.1 hypothetical protein B808_325 [Fructilactobacillus florum 8D]KRM92369.1 G-D-S-L family lipolytic protein [Fructilactobacillus florum DSM 22689 = JCM 16035]